MKPTWSEPAASDLVAIRRHVSQYDRRAALRLVDEIRQVVHEAAEWPLAGRVVPEWASERIRERPVRSRYRVVYRTPDGTTVLRVLEGHQLLHAQPDEQE